jgi:hypothetical protein
MKNECVFSPCRGWRYTLEHVIEEAPPLIAARRMQWIGLNPSTADENELDNTLRRVRAFSLAAGFGGFIMTNVFAWRATKPADMKKQPDPIGPENDAWLMRVAERCEAHVACWGGIANFPRALRPRAATVRLMFSRANRPLLCLKIAADGSPWHPLYVDGDTPLKPYVI